MVATESFTGGNYEAPFTLKKIADYWFAQGVNRLVFHTSAEQPLDSKPGNTMVGTHINRNITWAELAAPFMAYLSRNSLMLQQGLYVADVAYLLPEGAPSSQPFWGPGLHPACPEGYSYDCINTDVLLHRVSVADDGRLVLPDGMSYRVLVLPEIDAMTPKVLRKIHELVAGGATVVGQKPVKSPSLEGYPQADAEVQSLAAELWGDLDGVSRNRHFYGKGQVVWRLPLADVLALLPVPKDFECSRPLDADVAWIHRRADNADIYFVANHTERAIDLQTRYRVRDKEAELWHPDSAVIEPASYRIAEDRTTVPLHLAEREAVFVVFRRPTSEPVRMLPASTTTELAALSGTWELRFPLGWVRLIKSNFPCLSLGQPTRTKALNTFRERAPTVRRYKRRNPGSAPDQNYGSTWAVSKIWPKCRSMDTRLGYCGSCRTESMSHPNYTPARTVSKSKLPTSGPIGLSATAWGRRSNGF